MPDHFARLSRTIAHALRHRPEQYGLELDKDGWTPVETLVAALARDARWAELSADEIRAMMAAASKQRYDIYDGRIRAVYGHSLAAKVAHASATPPDRLYHGTAPGALAKIRREGLKPMRRQYVHLSTDTATAVTVAARRTAAGDHHRSCSQGSRGWHRLPLRQQPSLAGGRNRPRLSGFPGRPLRHHRYFLKPTRRAQYVGADAAQQASGIVTRLALIEQFCPWHAAAARYGCRSGGLSIRSLTSSQTVIA
jgi:putative RNA 2'-phosphotransferase